MAAQGMQTWPDTFSSAWLSGHSALPKSQSQQRHLQGARHARGSTGALLAASRPPAFCQRCPNMGHTGKRAAGGIHAKQR